LRKVCIVDEGNGFLARRKAGKKSLRSHSMWRLISKGGGREKAVDLGPTKVKKHVEVGDLLEQRKKPK